jgi:hypothetical protein
MKENVLYEISSGIIIWQLLLYAVIIVVATFLIRYLIKRKKV